MVIDDNRAGRDKEKALLHDKKWGVYTREKKPLIKGGYYVEVSGSDGNKLVW